MKGWRWIALAAGILSLLIRELAFPFIAVMLILSIRERKYKEAFIWTSGIAWIPIMMVIHISHIKDFVRPTTYMHLRNGSLWPDWKFVLETAGMHPYLFLVPDWFIAVLVPFTLIGLSGWGGPLGTRIGLTVGIYVLIFLFIGTAFQPVFGCTICEFITTWCVICA